MRLLYQLHRHAVAFIVPTPSIQYPAYRGTHFRYLRFQNQPR